MPAHNSDDPILPEEVAAFTGKLQEWANGLSARERSILQMVLSRAAGSEQSDVNGYDFSRPTESISFTFSKIEWTYQPQKP
jgi:hypothetical protein